MVVGDGAVPRHRTPVLRRGLVFLTGPGEHAGPAMRAERLYSLIASRSAGALEVAADRKCFAKQAATDEDRVEIGVDAGPWLQLSDREVFGGGRGEIVRRLHPTTEGVVVEPETGARECVGEGATDVVGHPMSHTRVAASHTAQTDVVAHECHAEVGAESSMRGPRALRDVERAKDVVQKPLEIDRIVDELMEPERLEHRLAHRGGPRAKLQIR